MDLSDSIADSHSTSSESEKSLVDGSVALETTIFIIFNYLDNFIKNNHFYSTLIKS